MPVARRRSEKPVKEVAVGIVMKISNRADATVARRWAPGNKRINLAIGGVSANLIVECVRDGQDENI